MIRYLTTGDIDQAIEIAKLKPIRGTPFFVDEWEIKMLFEEPKNKIIGYFENNILVTWIVFRFGTLHEEKVWCILHMFTRNFKDHFNFDGPDFAPIIKMAFELAESEGYYSYIYSVPKKSERAYYKKWKFKEGRYLTSDLAFIPADTEPPENWMKRLNGGIRNYDIVIKKRTLKSEFIKIKEKE